MLWNGNVQYDNFTNEDLKVFYQYLDEYINSSIDKKNQIISQTFSKLYYQKPYITLDKIALKYEELANKLPGIQSQQYIQPTVMLNNQPNPISYMSPQSSFYFFQPTAPIQLINNQQSNNNSSRKPKNTQKDKTTSKPLIFPTNESDFSDIEEITKEEVEGTSTKSEKETNQTDLVNLDRLKTAKSEGEFYNELNNLYKELHNSKSILNFNPEHARNGIIVTNPESLSFEKEMESKMMKILRIYLSLYPDKLLYSNDYMCDTARNPFYESDGWITKSLFRVCPPPINPKWLKDATFYKRDYQIFIFAKLLSLRRYRLSEKLLSFYTGDIYHRSSSAFRIDNIEAVTVVRYQLTLNTCAERRHTVNDNHPIFSIHCDGVFLNEYHDQFPVCIPIYVCLRDNSHILNFFGVEYKTDFMLPPKAIYFHRENETNKVYIFADVRLKEFVIKGFDDYVRNNYNGETNPISWNARNDQEKEDISKKVEIENTNTFNISQYDHSSSIITVCNDELVLALDNRIYFWKKNESSTEKKASTIDISEMKNISSLVPFQKENSNSFLAVASDTYPVIYVLNNEHQIILRLVSHTRGISSMVKCEFAIFSGSYDNTIRFWNLSKRVPFLIFDNSPKDVTIIENGVYCKQLFAFSGSSDGSVRCWNVNFKKLLFEIGNKENTTVKKIAFVSGKHKNLDDYATLLIISELNDTNNSETKSYRFQYYQFV